MPDYGCQVGETKGQTWEFRKNVFLTEFLSETRIFVRIVGSGRDLASTIPRTICEKMKKKSFNLFQIELYTIFRFESIH